MNESELREHLDADGLLDLSGLDLCDAHLEGWPEIPWLAQVISLDLSKNDLTDAGLDRLLRCEQLSRLDLLDLYGNDLSPTAGALLAATPFFQNLRALDLGSNPLGGGESQRWLRRRCSRLWSLCASHGARSMKGDSCGS